jgi:heme/copper-type cytochrome/quinol oxidase subunit 2
LIRALKVMPFAVGRDFEVAPTSTLAAEVDKLYFFVTAVTAFFALLVVICVVVCAVKDRDRTDDRVGASITSIPLELAWSIVPFFTSMAIFCWATVVFFDLVRAPDQTLEIHSIGKLPAGQPAVAQAGAAAALAAQGGPRAGKDHAETGFHALDNP